MRTTHGRLGVMASLPMLLGLGACGENACGEVDYEWPAMTLVAREGMAVLEIEDDEVLFEGVPFEGSVTIFPIKILTVTGPGSMILNSAGHKLSYVFDDRGTMEVSVGEPGSQVGTMEESDGVVTFTATMGGTEVSDAVIRFTVTARGEEVEFDGRRARLADGAKRVVFTKDGDIEVSDRE